MESNQDLNIGLDLHNFYHQHLSSLFHQIESHLEKQNQENNKDSVITPYCFYNSPLDTKKYMMITEKPGPGRIKFKTRNQIEKPIYMNWYNKRDGGEWASFVHENQESYRIWLESKNSRMATFFKLISNQFHEYPFINFTNFLNEHFYKQFHVTDAIKFRDLNSFGESDPKMKPFIIQWNKIIDNEDLFHQQILLREIKIVNPDWIFTFGNAAWKIVRNLFDLNCCSEKLLISKMRKQNFSSIGIETIHGCLFKGSFKNITEKESQKYKTPNILVMEHFSRNQCNRHGYFDLSFEEER